MGRLDSVLGFLGDNQQQKVLDLVDQGYKTAKDIFDQQVEVFRQPVGGGPPSSQGVIDVITIRFGQRGIEDINDYGPLRAGVTAGMVRIEEDVFDLRVDDVIVYEGRSCKVVAVYPPEFGVVIAELDLTQ